VVVRDLPVSDRPVVLVWAKRFWRCPEPACPAPTSFVGPRRCWPGQQADVAAAPEAGVYGGVS
jgi:hypothetical protein